MATADDPRLLDFLGGERFKGYEAETQTTLDGPFAAIRVDGKGFSRLTREQDYARPYDTDFMAAMDSVARHLLLLVEGAHFAYVQSDEVSVVFSPSGPPGQREWWFGGKVQKLVSLAASQSSLAFLRAELLRNSESSVQPLFDGRALKLQSAQDVEEYLRWRRFDAQKNSISMAASSRFSHGELQGVSSKERAEMLKGSDLERLPDGFFNGRLFYRTKAMGTGWNPALKKEVPVERTVIASHAADREFLELALPGLIADRLYS